MYDTLRINNVQLAGSALVFRLAGWPIEADCSLLLCRPGWKTGCRLGSISSAKTSSHDRPCLGSLGSNRSARDIGSNSARYSAECESTRPGTKDKNKITNHNKIKNHNKNMFTETFMWYPLHSLSTSHQSTFCSDNFCSAVFLSFFMPLSLS